LSKEAQPAATGLLSTAERWWLSGGSDMKFPEMASVVAVLTGAVIMLLSIALGSKIRNRFSRELSRRWNLVILLMVFFFVGYILFAVGFLARVRLPLELLTSTIFFAGACFVYLVVRLTETSVSHLQEEIRERRRLQELVSHGKREWEETFDVINDAITIHDRDFTVTRANRAARELLGLPFNAIVGQKCHRIYHATEGPPDACPSCGALQSGNPTVTEVFEPHLKKQVEIKALPRLGPDGDVIGLVHVMRDITSRKKMEGEREELIRELEDAISKIKTLRGLLPICAWCKNIRDDKGYWENLEKYIESHSDATFTHGICPECMKKVEGEIDSLP
jgi:PAS domain S-box-containing protein